MSMPAKSKRGKPTNRSSMYKFLRSNNFGSARPPRFSGHHLDRINPPHPGSWTTHELGLQSHLRCFDSQSRNRNPKEYLCSDTNDGHSYDTAPHDKMIFADLRQDRNHTEYHPGLPSQRYTQCHSTDSHYRFPDDVSRSSRVSNGYNADVYDNIDSRYDRYNDYKHGKAKYQQTYKDPGPDGRSSGYMRGPSGFAHGFEGFRCNGIYDGSTSSHLLNTNASVNPAKIASTFNHDEIVPTLVGVGVMRPHVLVGPFSSTYTMENIWEFVRGIPGVSDIALTVECYGYKSALIVFNSSHEACMAIPLINRYHQCLGHSTAAIICNTSWIPEQSPLL